jgi:hypothetical protein
MLAPILIAIASERPKSGAFALFPCRGRGQSDKISGFTSSNTSKAKNTSKKVSRQS